MVCLPLPSGKWQLVCLTLVNSVSMAHFGYDQGIFAGALISTDFLEIFPETKDPGISGITSSCFSLGAFFGCLASFSLGDRLGRKQSIYIGLAVNVVGIILQITAYHLPHMIVGRLINGFGMGITSSVCPVFMAEVSPSQIRGKLVVLGSLCNTVGFCLANWMSYALFDTNGPFQWRFPLAFQLVFSVIVLVFLSFTVDSPRWLLLRGRFEEGRVTLARLRGTMQDLDDQNLNDDIKSIQQALEQEKIARVSPVDAILCRDPLHTIRRLLLSCGTQFMQQFSGVNALGYYFPTVLIESVGVSSSYARLLAAVNASLYLGAAFVCLILIDIAGRRKLMMYGSIAMGSCYLVAATTLREAKLHPEQKTAFGKVTVAMFFLYYFCYGTSFAKVPWVYNSEINSFGWRTRGAAAATATNWMSGFIIVQFTKTGVDNLRWGFYLLFAGFCWSFLPVVFLFYPETSRRTLEDMDEMFKHHNNLLVFRDKILTQQSRPQAFIDAEQERIAEPSTLVQES
ncbi:general substrate transporter [Annulohypoxylon maeteangense]|uniref:general substrate transporter n=1 Tax=Annulohypoxylon maeteangense TaxID=1927788 RepID=UPI002008460B|nr:general substrate transporter [Annulohypoxylon maeteangense]KAI0888979.1 general substrate transporter [Annulohypoxylon maeteangense]